jgi:hypothetical protein
VCSRGDKLPPEVPNCDRPVPKREEQLVLVQEDERGGCHELSPVHLDQLLVSDLETSTGFNVRGRETVYNILGANLNEHYFVLASCLQLACCPVGS